MSFPCQISRAAAIAAIIVAPAASASFIEGFNTGTFSGSGAAPGYSVALASGNWYVLNISSPIGSAGVFRGSSASPFPPQEGAGFAGMNYQSGAGVSNIKVYLMTPEITLIDGGTFSFYTRTTSNPSAYPDRLRVVMSTNGASTASADFSTTLLTVNESLTTTGYPGTWTQYTVTLSGLGSMMSGRLAFLYDVPNGGPAGANSNYIGIDTVAYVPAPGAIALLGLAGFAGRRRR